jgi:hypothetical protein
MKKYQTPIPKTAKFQDRKSLYRVVDWVAEAMLMDEFIQDAWLTRSEVTMLILQGKEVKLIQTR